jgi:hypothetical protein
MQLELEPIGPDDLTRVRAQGYDGAVRVAAFGTTSTTLEHWEPGDLLIGLHIWPTTSVQDVAEVLERDDLPELNPLKFYVIRRVVVAGTPEKPQFSDRIRTGRVTVSVGGGFGGGGRFGAGFGSRRQSATTTAAEPAPTPSTATNENRAQTVTTPSPTRPEPQTALVEPTKDASDASANDPFFKPPQLFSPQERVATGTSLALDETKRNLRYEGKTFDQWRTAWQTELSTAKRIEAIKALAAFGASGYGQEATEAVLEIARHYDWRAELGRNELQTAIVDAFNGRGKTVHVIPARVWFPMLMREVRSGDKTMLQFAEWVVDDFHRLGSDGDFAVDSLLELSRTQSRALRGRAMRALANADRQHTNPKIVARLQEILEGSDVELVRETLASLGAANAPLPFDASSLLFHSDERVRSHARQVVRYLRPQQETDIDQFLLKILEDPSRANDHLAAIRALRALPQRRATSAYPLLERLAMDREQPMPIRIASAVAAEQIMRDGGLRNRLQQDLNNQNQQRRETPEFRMEFKQFEQAIEEERQSG